MRGNVSDAHSTITLSCLLSHALIVRSDAAVVLHALEAGIAEYGRGVLRTESMAPGTALRWLTPFRAGVPERYLVRPFGAWTAIVKNGGAGSLNEGASLSGELGVESYEILWMPQIRRISAYDAHGQERRLVQVYRDAGWIFVARGSPLAEEDPSSLMAKRTSMRLLPEDVVACMRKIAPTCGRNPWSLDGPPMIGLRDGPENDAWFSRFPLLPHVDDIGLSVAPLAVSEASASRTLSRFVEPAAFLSDYAPGSFAGGDKRAIETIVACLKQVAGLEALRFELQAWEDLESAPYAEALWVKGATRDAVIASLKSCADVAPDEVEEVLAPARPAELAPGDWLRLWWD